MTLVTWVEIENLLAWKSFRWRRCQPLPNLATSPWQAVHASNSRLPGTGVGPFPPGPWRLPPRNYRFPPIFWCVPPGPAPNTPEFAPIPPDNYQTPPAIFRVPPTTGRIPPGIWPFPPILYRLPPHLWRVPPEFGDAARAILAHSMPPKWLALKSLGVSSPFTVSPNMNQHNKHHNTHTT